MVDEVIIKDEMETTSESLTEENNPRENLNLQKFFDDMRMLGDQVKDRSLAKPPFNYGDLGVTNYLLWLLLGEIMILNDNIGEENA